MARNEAGLKKGISLIREMREEFWKDVKVVGKNEDINQTLERAGRVADYFEFAELLALDALNRNESCGSHFREEYQTEEGEAKRDDEHYAHVAAWEFHDVGKWTRHQEELNYEYVKLATRSYK